MIQTDFCGKLPPHYSGKYEGSFAYLTIKDRLPVILVKVLDTLCRDKHSIGNIHGEVGREDVKKTIGRLSALQNEMTTNKPIRPLTSDGADVSLWNAYLDEQNSTHDFAAAWYDSSWLYVECYLYRRMREAFELSSVLKDYDPFHKQKLDSLSLAMDDVLKLSKTLQQTVSKLKNSEDFYENFAYYLEVSLWGNKCDLSMSAGKENLPDTCEYENLTAKIVANDTSKVWDLLREANKKKSDDVHVGLVMDNAGFELFCDLCFSHFLLAAKLVSKVSMYVKRIPWFISDTLEKDIRVLLETLKDSRQEVLRDFGRQWSEHFESGRWQIEEECFWTLPHDYSEMQKADQKLYNKLSHGDLLIFKGDLNYRKLTGDRQWDETVPFETALNKFLPTSLVSLRTIKSEVIVGLASGTTEKLNNISLNWKLSGEYGLIQCVRKY